LVDSEVEEILNEEKGAGLFKRQRKVTELEQDVLNNRGKKWLRDQLGVTAVISGIGLLVGVSAEFWLGINLLSIPVTVYHARKKYEALEEKFHEEE
jgi:hypothetical protein